MLHWESKEELPAYETILSYHNDLFKLQPNYQDDKMQKEHILEFIKVDNMQFLSEMMRYDLEGITRTSVPQIIIFFEFS